MTNIDRVIAITLSISHKDFLNFNIKNSRLGIVFMGRFFNKKG